MQRYGRIFTQFWTSPDIIALSAETKCVGAYLLSCHHGNMIGCFRLPIAYVIEDLRMSSETVLQGFRNLSDKGFVAYDFDLSWVLIRKFLKWNPLENPNQGKAAAKLVEQVPESSSVYSHLLDMCGSYPGNFPAEFVNRIKTASEPSRNPQPQPQPQPEPQEKLVQLASEIGPDPYAPIVDRMFSLYCSLIDRNPKRYALTRARREKATARLKERERINSSLDAAALDLETAIRNLAASEYHRTGGYTDWLEQIFRSQEEFEKRLNWVAPKGVANGTDRNKGGAVTRTERHVGTWDAEAAEQRRLRTLGHDVPANGGILPAPGDGCRDDSRFPS